MAYAAAQSRLTVSTAKGFLDLVGHIWVVSSQDPRDTQPAGWGPDQEVRK
jgi:hypothetical protein